MTVADTLLFVALLALALWLRQTRLMLMAAVVAIAAGISAATENPSPVVGIAVFGIGVYLLASTTWAIFAARRSQRQNKRPNHSQDDKP